MNRRQLGVFDPYADRQLLRKGLDKPTLWLYYNDGDVNSRVWSDFGARSSRVLNLPFLNLCYQTIAKHNSEHYKIEVIGGLPGLLERFTPEELPASLRNNKTVVNEPELAFIRAAILAKYGGLWLTPGAICRKSFGELPDDTNIFFGTDLEDTFSGADGTAVPGMRAIWACRSQHPVFEYMAKVAFRRLEEAGGGLQIRNDAKWDYLAAIEKNPGTTRVIVGAELARKGADGKRIQLEDLLATNATEIMPFRVPEQALYTPIPIEELLRRRNFGWFLRMSEDQILDSDLAISVLYRTALGKD